jgi:hypothetical protein
VVVARRGCGNLERELDVLAGWISVEYFQQWQLCDEGKARKMAGEQVFLIEPRFDAMVECLAVTDNTQFSAGAGSVASGDGTLSLRSEPQDLRDDGGEGVGGENTHTWVRGVGARRYILLRLASKNSGFHLDPRLLGNQECGCLWRSSSGQGQVGRR